MKYYDILIVGAGPVGLFTVFEAGLLGLKCALVDALDRPGGQCTELYPEKPIYDIPGVPVQTAQQHVDALLDQIKPFDYDLYLDNEILTVNKAKENLFVIELKSGDFITCGCIFIASGGGKFVPKKPNLDNLDKYENTGFVNYNLKNIDSLKDKEVIIFGAGDSALDWCLLLSDRKIPKKITLVHRTGKFRASPHSVDALMNKVGKNEINLYLNSNAININDQGVLINSKESEYFLKADKIFMFFGLIMSKANIKYFENLWGINGLINVNTENFQTSIPGVYAVGDCNAYPGKLKLILSGFHETTLAVQSAYKNIKGEVPEFQYTTTSTNLIDLLKR